MCVYVYMKWNITNPFKKSKNNAICSRILSEVSQRKTNTLRYHIYAITYTRTLKYTPKISRRSRNTHRHREQAAVARGWGTVEWESGISRCKLLKGEARSPKNREHCSALG